ncbi:MAG: hypothetical protein ABSH52_04260 [Terriglobia bacterium]
MKRTLLMLCIMCSISAVAQETGRQVGVSARFRTMALQKRFNLSYDRLMSSLLERPQDSMVNDSGTYFPSQAVVVSGVPFQVGTEGNNLVSPSPPPPANDDMIENFGVKVKRSRAAPISRDSLTEVGIEAPTSEVFMLLAAELPSKRHDSGGAQCMSVGNVEWFAVELQYEDGTSNLAFPYLIQDRRHVIQRMLTDSAKKVTPTESNLLTRAQATLLGNIVLAGA